MAILIIPGCNEEKKMHINYHLIKDYIPIGANTYYFILQTYSK